MEIAEQEKEIGTEEEIAKREEEIAKQEMAEKDSEKMIKTDTGAGIICCSNGMKKEYGEKLKYLEQTLLSLGLKPVFASCIYERDGAAVGYAKERAQALMKFYLDESIKVIFDISGGNIAEQILPFLDYRVISNSKKMFWGYSDLTTVINAIYAKTKRPSVLYQIRNLIYDHRDIQIERFKNTISDRENDLFDITYHFIQRDHMQGIVIGGNIRCLLKLAGTEYMPDLRDCVLLLESYSGTASEIENYLERLRRMGAFEKAAGILLGTFTKLQAEKSGPPIERIVQKYAGTKIPIAVTNEIGHGTDAKGILIGREFGAESKIRL